ncbi:MAG: tRNA (adenosine(37)-N6)-threonylcarbamoyltransferase complex dimerization subunit type 1 TsaB [bacterium]|nr:tRNA (adenosine(37)-N6)-threonylcarbamoyltransferase complex dimerization subunit type 1 TsaB [Gammaproteobacteria bacterium]HIL99359.1 tRNA (adenosine(37)-N6)-threonylcarbamoyltransferase complex dimerization subunit type 1 TsaB [Pseudomonadales bacterium]
MNVLAIDTSTNACVLAVSTGRQLFEDAEIVERTHSKVILPRIVRLLSEAKLANSELDLIVFGQGPGSFTGLRIGIGVVQGLAFGLEIPVVGISSMACLAQNAFRVNGHKHSIVALTARKQEVYFGSYSIKDGFAVGNGTEGVFEADEVPKQEKNKNWIGIGSGWQLKTRLQQGVQVTVGDIYPNFYPTGRDLVDQGLDRHNRGLSVSAQQARPEYLREQVASAKPRQ